MYVKQISVFLENTKGSLSLITRLMGDAGLDLIALSIADTEHYGILRCIVTDTDKAMKVIKEAGYTARLTDVLAVCVSDKPGGLADVLQCLNDHDISVEYLYSFVRASGDYALVIFQLTDIERGRAILLEKDVRLLEHDEIQTL